MVPSPSPDALERLVAELIDKHSGDSETQVALRQIANALRQRTQEQQAQVARLRTELEQQRGYLREEIRAELRYQKLIGNSEPMRRVRQAIAQVAPTDSTVLVTGETGTGKELVARAIHEQSGRRGQLLVSVNCAALTPGLLASELFGHEAGAFTGANKRRIGRFELAHRGTLFLDEVADLPAETQVLLLRVLQERILERVGGNEPIAVDVRLIAATNRDLAAAVRENRFRSDLFYRLNVFPMHVPPLRERTDDIALLLHHFRVQLNRRMHKRVVRIEPPSIELARRYTWPGNVRELENLVERAMIVVTDDTLRIEASWLAASTSPQPAALNATGLADVERRTILDALRRTGGKIYGPSGAAAALGLKPTTLYGKMRRHQIQKRAGDSTFA
jgi:formate hydrogenlyase transcriptional activator